MEERNSRYEDIQCVKNSCFHFYFASDRSSFSFTVTYDGDIVAKQKQTWQRGRQYYLSPTFGDCYITDSQPSKFTMQRVILFALFLVPLLCCCCKCSQRERQLNDANNIDTGSEGEADDSSTLQEKRFKIEQQLIIREVLATTDSTPSSVSNSNVKEDSAINEDVFVKALNNMATSERVYGSYVAAFSQRIKSNRSINVSERLEMGNSCSCLSDNQSCNDDKETIIKAKEMEVIVKLMLLLRLFPNQFDQRII